MSLDEYRRKRDFTISPEPAGERRAKRRGQPRGRFFCVQKHLASRLHYDFRLEHNGVLLSWAVPKGPSLDPADKRMAVHVEDHPVEYGDFEGVIPEGYGAGIVMLWDCGTWAPQPAPGAGARTDSDSDRIIDEALKRGELKFTLDGYKLKGSWVLVRTRDRAGTSPGQLGRSWLLIKHRDDWSGPLDITTFAPRSVKSDGELEDILAGEMPAIWLSHKPGGTGTANRMLQEVIRRAAEKIAAREARRRTTARKPRKTTTGRTSRSGPTTPHTPQRKATKR